MNESPLASFLLPEGYRRPPVVAVLNEARIAGEARRYATRALSARLERRRTPYVAGPQARDLDPVLLVPGFLAGDYTLRFMAAALRKQGMRTYRSHIVANVGCTLDAAHLIEQRLEAIANKRGTRVQLVGHSLGGMLARGIAVRRPDLVSGIVTMGSPMLAPAAHHRALTAGLGGLIALSKVGVPRTMTVDCVGGPCARESFEESRQPVPADVAFTAIYSRRDGIVDWRACIDPTATAVEVRTSHVGMVMDPAVITAVTEALVRHRGAREETQSWVASA
ncbi:Alpha/beta hydrolase family protein [Nocardioides dokdonensis FR1436]|uniref:Alpha/beta hydrolase family protein n=1 Tax=Nocardioides dokdonensis FR1436 TaxID=1300347 RepID=A0A1A9GJH8_9ACTN|nr:alpha/beta fold hydrolase [Nocardioides dokdonensis]ANH38487.1 Alpha/beta hydrolase family protein [Nocardioides dokdonensis FR1436]